MLRLLRRVWEWLNKSDRVYDLSGEGVSLPLALRQAADIQIAANVIAICSKCSIKYFVRPTQSAVPENGECYRCATGAEPYIVERDKPAKVMPMRRRAK